MPELTEDDAAKMMRQRRRYLAEIAETERHAAADIAETEQWLADRTHGARQQVDNIDAALTDWFAERLAENPDGPRSLTFPAGRVGSRAGGLKLVVEDEDAALAWSRDNRPELVVQPDPPAPRPDKAALKKLALSKPDEPGDHPVVVEGGEVVPGVRFVRDPRSFYVEEVAP